MCDERRYRRVLAAVLLLSFTLLNAPVSPALTPGTLPKDAPAEWVTTQIGGNVFCLGISWGGPLPSNSGTVFSDFFRIDFSGVCSANGGPGGSGVFPAKRGEAHWAGAFFTDTFTNCSLAAGIPHGRFRMNEVIVYPVVRALIYDRDGMIRSVDHYQGGGPAPIYAADGKQPALWLPFDWGQLRPVHELALELTDKPYLKDPTRPDEENLDSIFLLRDEMTVLSGDGKLSDANGWWTAWAGRGDVLLTRLRPKAFTLPGYVPPVDALSDSPPVEIDASDMNPWVAEVMTGSPDLYEPLNMTYSPPLGNHVTNDPDDDRRAQVWLSPDYESQRAPYTMIGQAYQFPLVTGVLHTAYADICPLTQDTEGNDTCLPHPYFSPDAPQAGVPSEERTTPVYTFPASETPDGDVWLEISATWWDTRTKEEQQAQSGDADGVAIAHPKGILTSLSPDGDSSLAERLHWRLVTPSNRPDLLETLPATMASEPFTRLIPHARLNISEPGVYDVELSVVGDDGDRLMLDTMQVQVIGVDLDAHWPGTMAEPGPLVSDVEERDALNLIASVNDDDDNDDSIIDNDRTQSPAIVPEDDEVMTVIVRALAVNPGVGTLELFAGNGLHFFTADGTQELSLPLLVDLAHPSGPLADAVNAEHPRDVTLLVEANIPVERTMVELIYSQNGEEMARDDVHVRVVDIGVKGGFYRGSVQYAEAMQLGSKTIVFGMLTEEYPLSVLLSNPQKIYRYMQYKPIDAPDTAYQDGWLLDYGFVQYFDVLLDGWNTILSTLFDWFDFPNPYQYERADTINTLSEASGIPEDVLKSGYFATDPNEPITLPFSYKLTSASFEELLKDSISADIVERLKALENTEFSTKEEFKNAVRNQIGEEQANLYQDHMTRHAEFDMGSITYLVKFLDAEKNEETIHTMQFTVMRSGRLNGHFRVIGNTETPYCEQQLLEDVTENGQSFWRTLGGMRLRVDAVFSEHFTPYSDAVMGYEWMTSRNSQFVFSAATLEALEKDLVKNGIPRLLIDQLKGLLKDKTFATRSELLTTVRQAFTGFMVTDAALISLKQRYIEKERIFPTYYCDDDDGLGVLKDIYYPTEEAFLYALRNTRLPGNKFKYATAGYRVSPAALTRLMEAKFPEQILDQQTLAHFRRFLTVKSLEENVTTCDGDGDNACIRGKGGEGYSFRNVNADDEFEQFTRALQKALGGSILSGF